MKEVHVDNNELRAFIQSEIEELLNSQEDVVEANVTGNIDGGSGPPKTPKAFRKRNKKAKTGRHDGHHDPEVFDYKRADTTNKHIKKLYETDIKLSSNLKKLEDFIDNSSTLFKRIRMPILKQIHKAVAHNKFSLGVTARAFKYLVEQGAKEYAKEQGTTWTALFSKKDIATLALKYAQDVSPSEENA